MDLPELGPRDDRGGIDTLGDLLPFPLGEHAQEMEEHPASGGAGVNGFGERN